MKIPTSCDVLQSNLKAYLDGELSTPRRLLVRTHLLRCADCRAEVEIMKIIGHDLRDEESARHAPFGDALRQRILDKLPATPPTFDHAALRNSVRLNNRAANLILAGGVATLVSVMFLSPEVNRARENARKSSVVNNLKQVPLGIRDTEESAIASKATNASAGAMPPPDSNGGRLTRMPEAIAGKRPSTAQPRFWDNKTASADISETDSIAAITSNGTTSQSGVTDTFSVQFQDNDTADATIALKSGTDSEFNRRIDRVQKRMEKQRIAGLPPGMPPTSGGGSDSEPSILRRVHREARMTVAVDDIETQSDTVEQLVRGAGGYVVSNNLSTGSDNRKTATLDLRVPVSKFETIIGEFSHLGDVRAKNITGQDITEQYSNSQQAKNVLSNDLSIREAQLKAALAKAEKEAKRHKQTPEDPWQLRAEVRRLRIEAAQVRARIEILRKLSDLSQITVELQEKQPAPDKGVFGKEMRETGQAATDTFLAAVRLPLKFLLWAFAYSPLWLPVVLFYRWLFPRRDAGNAPANIPPGAATGGSASSRE